MKIAFAFILSVMTLFFVGFKIKNNDNFIEMEPGTNFNIPDADYQNIKIQNEVIKADQRLGYWVGDFEPYDDINGLMVDDGFYWNRTNKINISIDSINGNVVVGHSVVAGNNRPFTGYFSNGKFVVKEPGDDRYDGVFSFEIINNQLVGTWEAYKNLEIKKRKFALDKRIYKYDSNITLEENTRYIDWGKKVSKAKSDDEFGKWISTEYASATEKIYSINASNSILTTKDVANLKKGDLTIIRNTIYARHGYSFKSRPLRVFFDQQSWYIPVHADIKQAFTEIEKRNIELLLKYEKNAKEYYDYFGRG
jgi:hypothetical protein